MENPKSQTRNPKEIAMPEMRNARQNVSRLPHWNLKFPSDFGFGIWDFNIDCE
jgi:hypothetical protein